MYTYITYKHKGKGGGACKNEKRSDLDLPLIHCLKMLFYLKMELVEFELIKALIVFDSGADLMLTYPNNEMQIGIFLGTAFLVGKELLATLKPAGSALRHICLYFWQSVCIWEKCKLSSEYDREPLSVDDLSACVLDRRYQLTR